MLVSLKDLLKIAKDENFAVAAPIVFNHDSIVAAYELMEEEQAPLIFNIADRGPEYIRKMAELVRFVDKDYPKARVTLMLDHGRSYESMMAAVCNGFGAVMADYSTLSYQDNLAAVKRICEPAHAVGVSVEAELGHVGQGFEYEKTRDNTLSDPDEVVSFVKDSACDALAIAVGTSHGVYKGTPRIDFERLSKIRSLVDTPLVLHGGSGTGDDNLSKAVQLGINKVNLHTDLARSYINENKMADETKLNFFQYYMAGVNGWKEECRRYIRLFNSQNQLEKY